MIKNRHGLLLSLPPPSAASSLALLGHQHPGDTPPLLGGCPARLALAIIAHQSSSSPAGPARTDGELRQRHTGGSSSLSQGLEPARLVPARLRAPEEATRLHHQATSPAAHGRNNLSAGSRTGERGRALPSNNWAASVSQANCLSLPSRQRRCNKGRRWEKHCFSPVLITRTGATLLADINGLASVWGCGWMEAGAAALFSCSGRPANGLFNAAGCG